MIDQNLRQYHDAVAELVDALNAYWPMFKEYLSGRQNVVEEDKLYPVDINFNRAMNASKGVSLAMWKIIESGKSCREQGRLLGQMDLFPVQSAEAPLASKGPIVARVEDTKSAVISCEVGIAWDQLPYIRNFDTRNFLFTYRSDVERIKSKVKWGKWLNSHLFSIKVDLHNDGRIAYSDAVDFELGNDHDRDSITRRVFSYKVDDFLLIYRNTIAAHLTGRKESLKRRTLSTLLKSGPYPFRRYAQALLSALAQDFLLGLLTLKRGQGNLKQRLQGQVFLMDIEYHTYFPTGGPVPSMSDVIPRYLHITR